MTDALAERDGLSEPLRVLLKEYPREAWEADPAFSDLIRFWLERHAMFREICVALVGLLEGHLDGRTDPQRTAPNLSRYGNALLGGLHEHHHIEDEHYFPRLIPMEPRLEHAFQILDADHHDLAERLEHTATAANAVLRSTDDRRAVDKALVEVRLLQALLHRHLWDEEEVVVPVLLKHGLDA
ncbi:MAG: hemerythrin domain-containing protein [Pseudomonadota bacterium]